MNRLLTDEYINLMWINHGYAMPVCGEPMHICKEIAKAQRDLTASIVRADTLKEVGEALGGCYEIQKDGSWFWNPQCVRKVIEALQQGEMP